MKHLLAFSAIALIFCSCIFYNRDKANEINRQGLKFEQSGDNVAARKLFIEASQMADIADSDKSVYLTNAAMAYPENVDSARYYYSLAAKLNDSGSYFFMIDEAHINVLDSNVAAAIYHLNKAYKIKRHGMAVNSFLGTIYLGDYGALYFSPQKAFKYNEQAYNLYRDAISKFVLAKNYYYLKNYRTAEKLFEEIHRSLPADASYLYTLIMIKQENGEKDESNRLLSELKQLDIDKYNQYMNMKPPIPGRHSIVWNS